MKLIKLLIFVALLSFSSCDVLNQLPSTGSSSGGVTDAQIGSGLKEALNQGITKGVEQLIKTDGYFKNELIKILLPPEAKDIQNVMAKIPGGTKLLNDAVLKMNRAAEDAANEAKPIFVNAIKSMSFADARNILFGTENAATQYLKDKTFQSLTQAYSPRINNSLSKVGATQAWSAVIKPYNKFPGTQDVNSDLGAYVTEKALDGLFFKVKEEEKKIRENVASRSSKLMKDVFGLLDK